MKKIMYFGIGIGIALILLGTLFFGAPFAVTALNEIVNPDLPRNDDTTLVQLALTKLVGDPALLRNKDFDSISVMCQDNDGFDVKARGIGVMADVPYRENCIDRGRLAEVTCVPPEAPLDFDFAFPTVPSVDIVTCTYGCDAANGACLCEGGVPCTDADAVPQENLIRGQRNLFSQRITQKIRMDIPPERLSLLKSVLQKIMGNDAAGRYLSSAPKSALAGFVDSCEDSDGNNPLVQGSGKIDGGADMFNNPVVEEYTEQCYDNDKSVIEVVCTEYPSIVPDATVPLADKLVIFCKYGCDKGACLCEGGTVCPSDTLPEKVSEITDKNVDIVPEPVPEEGPSCTDKILNQGEENTDCGGPCPACPKEKICIYESDKGDDKFTPGFVTLDLGDGDIFPKNDECKSSTQLAEQYCAVEGNKIDVNTNVYNCDCVTSAEGAGYCVKEDDIMCTDTDADAGTKTVGSWPYKTTLDLELLTQGTATKGTKDGTVISAKTDNCVVEGGTKVIEASCSGKEVTSKTKTCPVIDVPDAFGDDVVFVCEGGACCQKKYTQDLCVENDAGADTVNAGTTSIIGSCNTGVKEEKTDSCVVVSCELDGKDNVVVGADTYGCPAGTGPVVKEFGGGYGDAVKEYSCDSIASPIKEQVVACKKGELCAMGACVPAISCFDTDEDEADQSLVPGYAYGIITSETDPYVFGAQQPYSFLGADEDFCKDKNTLVEFQCGLPEGISYMGGADVYVTPVEISCPNGCVETEEGARCKEPDVNFIPDINSDPGCPGCQ